MIIRQAHLNDAPSITAIYAHHVAHGTGSFDYDAPDAAFWTQKITTLGARGWPFLVAERDGKVAGYAYAAQFKDRQGYRFTCEDSIYIAPEAVGQGVGSTLLTALIAAATASGFREMIAVIGGGEPASMALHARCGFRVVGRLEGIGFKHDRVLDIVQMQRSLTASP
jgi:L-amino acid N-acyltransferase YncA